MTVYVQYRSFEVAQLQVCRSVEEGGCRLLAGGVVGPQRRQSIVDLCVSLADASQQEAVRQQVQLQCHCLRLTVQQMHQQAERHICPTSDVVEAPVPTLQVVVGSDLLLVHGYGHWGPQRVDDPRLLYVLQQVSNSWRVRRVLLL